MSGRPIRVVVVDFDGVILESNDLKTRGFEHVFGAFPAHTGAMLAYHHAHVSMSRFSKFEHLVVDLLGRRPGDSLIDELAAEFSRVMLDLIETCPFVPGAREFLDYVSSRAPLYVSSMTPHDELLRILERRGLAKTFDGAFGCPPWPKRGVLASLIAEHAVAGADLLFVGDSAGDQRAARDAGVEFAARDSGLPFEAPMPSTFPDMRAVLEAVSSRLPPPRAGS